eukprot:TRINITY_DN59068_c0_g2_i1.p1 TRINITY_DN59068_c0_g2~~TRINITY_DN59068_c0_g2_i1.p1  ORF type:complete len:216 (-),score=25.02 TRINITY_DN59068_c0_g2_i1:48-695(-)
MGEVLITIDGGTPQPYIAALNSLISQANSLPEEENGTPTLCKLQLHCGSTASTTFVVRVNDLYFEEFFDQKQEKFLPIPFSVSYTRMATVSEITAHSIMNAMLENTTKERFTQKSMRILIFVLAEAAHFELIRNSLVDLWSGERESIDLESFDVLIHNWSALRKEALAKQHPPAEQGKSETGGSCGDPRHLVVTAQDLLTTAHEKLCQWYKQHST